MNDISYEEMQRQQLHSISKTPEAAHEPANTVRTRINLPAALEIDAEYPIRFTPRVEVYLGAICNTVNEVVEAHPIVEVEDNPISLFRPLSRAKSGIAVAPLEKLYAFLADVTQHNYLLLATDEAAITNRLTTMVDSIHAQLRESFGGDPLESEGFEFSVARSDFFKTSVGYRVEQTQVGLQTVNDIQLVVSVYIHAASLTKTSLESMDALNTVNSQYRTVIRNFVKATGIDTTLNIAFDVGNFSVRPSVLSLFSALIADGAGEATAVSPRSSHLPDGVNILVSLDLKSKG